MKINTSTPILYFSLLALAIFFSACKNSDSDGQITELKNIANDLISKPETTIDEVNKLRQFEYKIVNFPIGSTSEEVHNELNALGQNYWDCFAVEKSEENGFFVFCKRRPDTPLRYVPRGILPNQ